MWAREIVEISVWLSGHKGNSIVKWKILVNLSSDQIFHASRVIVIKAKV
jgi:hypothetical protein